MVKVALAQFSGNRDKDANLAKVEALTRQAATQGARIVCFPELCTTMYFCFESDPAYFAWAEPIPGPSVDRVRRLARETGTLVVLPLFEVAAGRYFNSAAVIGPQGELIGTYRKSCIARMAYVDPGETTSDEKFYFEPGDTGYPVFPTPFGINLGVLICRDRHYAEAARILALRGAHLLLVPAATFREWAREVWDVELRAHAIQNGYYVGAVNKVGTDVGGSRDRPHFGSAVFVHPRGQVLASAGRDHDEVVYGDVESRVVEDTRRLTDFFGDRRPETYGPLTERIG